MPDDIVVITTGGTIDKVYFDAQSAFEVGKSVLPDLLKQARVTCSVRIIELMQKDSLNLNSSDRAAIRQTIRQLDCDKIIVTHGTDTMDETAHALAKIKGKTIVLTGALAPARFARTDAAFNVGLAFGAVQGLSEGVYIAMNGQVFDGLKAKKNPALGKFEKID